jgi:O-acetyl-ADP-ribose deacetylase (regulator of RNase III)
VNEVPVVFVNYRVLEQPGYATLLYRELAHRFGRESVFLASRSIHLGDDFVREVFDNLRRCQVLLAVIGPRWLEFGGGKFDWVHREIAEAFKLGIRVIPVLLEDAELPDEAALPEDIKALRRCQHVRLRHYSIDADIAKLVDELRGKLPALREPGDRVADGPPVVFRLASGSSCRIAVVPGDIRRVRSADLWVNSENTDMQMARFSDFATSAVIRYWGSIRDQAGRVVHDVIADGLARQVGLRRPVAPGTVIVTRAGALTASNNVRHILHVAAVQGEPGAGFRQVRDIGWCVTNALMHAGRLAQVDPRVRSVLFPLLGTGVAGGAVEPTIRAMLRATLDYLDQHPDTPLRLISFLAYDEGKVAAVHRVVPTLPLVRIGVASGYGRVRAHSPQAGG